MNKNIDLAGTKINDVNIFFIITDGDNKNKKEGSKMKSSSVQECRLKICKLFIDDLIISVISLLR